MKVCRQLDDVRLDGHRSVLTIGNFDGVHRGHQQLLAQGALYAAGRKAPLAVLTFEPHPLTILRPDRAPQRLMTLDDKLDVLARHDVDLTVVAESTSEFLALEPEAFIKRIVDVFHPTHIVEGSTFGFGRNRRGTPELLQNLGAEYGFETCIINPVELTLPGDETVTVSSSVIRRLISDGKVHLAALSLGRPYALTGFVVSGEGRGAGLGFPTANLENMPCLIPADGVYAGSARVGSVKCLAGISIGTNPTFGNGARKVEAHLLDFHEPIGGKTVRVEFGRWLREQRAFPSADELKQQIDLDIQAVRAHGADSGAATFRRRGADDGGTNA